MQLPCPMCGEPKADISVELRTPGLLHCGECDADFTTQDVERFIRQWTALLPWIKAMPVAAVEAAAADPAGAAVDANGVPL
jgi:hypothetical protein